MKSYPSIFNKPILGKPIYAFDKLDGSNLRAEWSKKKGFYKFGTRNHLLDKTDQILGEGIDLFLEEYGTSLPLVFKSQKWDRAICYFEFYGLNSFAGSHIKETHEVTLFDVAGKGLLEPKKFLDLFGHLKHAPLLYKGPLTSEFIESVQNSELEGMTYEGVICKGDYESPGLPYMCKIKSKIWKEKVQERWKGDPAKIEELL